MSRYTFTKLSSSIVDSTVWQKPDHVRLVWITMLAKADQHGRVFASLPGLAHAARVTVEQAAKAIQDFISPDEYSTTPDHEGRRIEPIDGGWRLLNHANYRKMSDREARRKQNREAQQRHREKERQQDDVRRPPVSNLADESASSQAASPESAQADADADADVDADGENNVGVPGGGLEHVRRPEDGPQETDEVLRFNSRKGPWVLQRRQLKGWEAAFPGLNVLDELKRAQTTLDTRKLRRDVRTVLWNWLQRAATEGGLGTPESWNELEATHEWNRSDRGGGNAGPEALD